jgi:hypothetical protein
VAGLIAVKARRVARREDMFVEFKAQTGLFPTSTYDIRSLSNPLIAGGMHFTVVRQGAFGTLIKGIGIERSVQSTVEQCARCR